MNETRRILRHMLAALAYRTQKALAGAPDGFGDFQAGNESRTPTEIVRHMKEVLGYARTFFIGGRYQPDTAGNLATETARFHEILYYLSSDLESSFPLKGITYEQLLQGPLSDAMTHAGQLAMLRRLSGAPIAPENFVFAEIQTENVGPEPPALK